MPEVQWKVLGEEESGTCNRCGMLQCMDICNRDVIGKIMIKGREDSVVLKVYGTVLEEIVGVEEITGLDTMSSSQPSGMFEKYK